MTRTRRSGEPTDGVCQRHRTPTQLRCVRCEKPICPRCLVQTPVGFMCTDHEGAPVKRAEDLPLTSKYRPMGPHTSQGSSLPLGLLLLPAMLLLGPVLGAVAGSAGPLVFAVPLLVLVVIAVVAGRRRR